MSERKPKSKSGHLEDLEQAFERRTRRFSPFEILGLNEVEPASEADDQTGEDLSAAPKTKGERLLLEDPVGSPPAPVDSTSVSSTSVDPTHPHVGRSHSRVVVLRSKSIENTTTLEGNPHTHMDVDSTHTHVGQIHTTQGVPTASSGEDMPAHQIPLWQSDGQVQNVAAAMIIRGQITDKARQVLAYLNETRALNQPMYTLPIGYAQISAAAGLSDHYLRRNVLPKLTMLGLIGIAQKGFQGTSYHLYHDEAFLRLITAGDDELGVQAALPAVAPAQPTLLMTMSASDLPSWISQEYWDWLSPEMVPKLVSKAGSEEQAKEKLDIIVYNETHGPEARRVRDRRAVLAHYLRTAQADIWPNDDGYETLSMRQAQRERDRALKEKSLAEETLQARQDAAKATFMTTLDDQQLGWLKLEAKQRVDIRPDAQFLESRYPLYKAEEEALILEWMDRVAYGESVPFLSAQP